MKHCFVNGLSFQAHCVFTVLLSSANLKPCFCFFLFIYFSLSPVVDKQIIWTSVIPSLWVAPGISRETQCYLISFLASLIQILGSAGAWTRPSHLLLGSFLSPPHTQTTPPHALFSRRRPPPPRPPPVFLLVFLNRAGQELAMLYNAVTHNSPSVFLVLRLKMYTVISGSSSALFIYFLFGGTALLSCAGWLQTFSHASASLGKGTARPTSSPRLWMSVLSLTLCLRPKQWPLFGARHRLAVCGI